MLAPVLFSLLFAAGIGGRALYRHHAVLAPAALAARVQGALSSMPNRHHRMNVPHCREGPGSPVPRWSTLSSHALALTLALAATLALFIVLGLPLAHAAIES